MTGIFDHGGTVFSVARTLGVLPEEVLDFSASINPLGPVAGVKEAVCAQFHRVVHYPDSSAAELAQALADLHGVEQDNVCIANGSTELIHLLPRLVSGSRALIIAPPFSEYGRALANAGWQTNYLPLSAADGFALSLQNLTSSLREGYALLVLANPGNPTGALIPRSEMEAVCAACRAAGTFFVIDEAFMDFCEGESVKKLIVECGNGLVLRSLTKFYALPGLRLGYSLAAQTVTTRLAGLRPPWSVSFPAQVAGRASLADQDYREHTLALISRERTFLATALAALPGLHPYPSAANYLLVRMSGDQTAAELQQRLFPERILIRDCASFPGLDGHYFRVSVRGREDNERLVAALNRALMQ